MRYRNRIISYAFIVIAALIYIQRWNYIYFDSEYYIALTQYFKYGTPLSPRSPFSFRILVPLIASLIPLSSSLASSSVSLISGVLWAILVFEISFNYSRSYLGSIAATISSYSLALANYSAVPLVDSTAVFLSLLAIYLCIKDFDIRYSIIVVLIGVLAKESVLFVLLFILIYRRDKRMIPIALVCGILLILYRYVFFGIISQPLGFTLDNILVRNDITIMTSINTLSPVLLVSCTLFFAWMDHLDLGEILHFSLSGVLAFAPYVFLGLFFAFFDARFLWPLIAFFAPLGAVGISEIIRIILHLRVKIAEKEVSFININNNISKSRYVSISFESFQPLPSSTRTDRPHTHPPLSRIIDRCNHLERSLKRLYRSARSRTPQTHDDHHLPLSHSPGAGPQHGTSPRNVEGVEK